MRPAGAALSLAGTLWLAAAGAAAAGDAADGPQILISNFMFQPATLTVRAGATVTWVNQDNEPHTVTSETGLFRSGAVDTGERFAYRFATPGTYRFSCSIHPQMVGTVVVNQIQ